LAGEKCGDTRGAKIINALDNHGVQMHTRIGKRRKSILKGMGNGFPKILRRYLERVGPSGVAGLNLD
jgi:hypothetical protein